MKALIKVFFLWALAVVARWSGLDFLVRYYFSPAVTVLTFHRIGSSYDPLLLTVSEDRFRKIVALIKEESAIFTLSEALSLVYCQKKREHVFVLTFDDGYADNLLLKKFTRNGVPAILFFSGYHIGKEILWPYKITFAILNTQVDILDLNHIGYGKYNLTGISERFQTILTINQLIKDEDNCILNKKVGEIVSICETESLRSSTERMLTWQELSELHLAGLNLGAHTWRHAILTRISLDLAKDEIIKSVEAVRKISGSEADIHFAYPNGRKTDFNDSIVKLVQEAGCASACTTIFGINRKSTDRYQLRRIPVTQNSFLNPFGRFSRSRFLSETSGFIGFTKSFIFNSKITFFKKSKNEVFR
jgi:peptidoglycan/xylan/chitin deacetylase (PgdA/CDA1 family)